ncbi:DUF2834 domain-containing protein [Nocardia sp. NPDC055321]
MSSSDPGRARPSGFASRTVRCSVYAVIALAGLLATWLPNFGYTFTGFMDNFMSDLRVTPASRSYTGDLLILALAAVVLMVIEARRHGVKFVWLYIFGGFATAMAFTFPLFLIAREMRMTPADDARVRTVDLALLMIVTVLVAGQLVWVALP